MKRKVPVNIMKHEVILWNLDSPIFYKNREMKGVKTEK